jgi:hypothetical protein
MNATIPALLALAALGAVTVTAAEGPRRVLSHDVYFTLNDASPAARQKLVEACRLYLTGHDGAVAFAAGVRAEEMKRDVNDTGFDVSLHVSFRDQAAHDAYQEHPRHLQFIESMRSNWKAVRVFDSWVEAGR